ncbi:hypothetical protein HK405_006689 [Cladochytrium tenue]|nr:hypothetical protein HK405_006689 [Cladochytrium tenue]
MPTRRTRQGNPISLCKTHSVDAGQYTGTVSEFARSTYGQKKPTGQAAGSDALANATPSGSKGPRISRTYAFLKFDKPPTTQAAAPHHRAAQGPGFNQLSEQLHA